MEKKYYKKRVSVGLIVFFLIWLAGSEMAFARKVYSTGNGNWQTAASWTLGVPVNGDTVIIQSGHTISVTGNLYSTSISMFVVVVGTLDLGNNGKLSFNTTSSVIVETGGSILGTSNGAQITFGGGTPEYRGMFQGTVTGPAYVSNNHNPTSGEGTGPNYTPGTIPLPIELASFTAEQSGDEIILSWSTVSELNFHYFSIERSPNGRDFEEIGKVDGHGTTKVKQNYSFDDRYPQIGKNYYRLKSVDFDGYEEYFNMIMEDYSGKKVFSIYPNPSDGTSLSYQMNFAADENSTIAVYDNLGAKVGTTYTIDQNNTLTFLNPLNRGVYYVKIVSNNFSSIERFVVR